MNKISYEDLTALFININIKNKDIVFFATDFLERIDETWYQFHNSEINQKYTVDLILTSKKLFKTNQTIFRFKVKDVVDFRTNETQATIAINPDIILYINYDGNISIIKEQDTFNQELEWINKLKKSTE